MIDANKKIRPARPRSRVTDSSRNRKLRPPRNPMTPLWVILLLLFFAEGLFYAWCRVQCVNAGYAIDRQTNRHQALLKERNVLSIELDRLNHPERIENYAKRHLGLVFANAQQTITVP